MKNCLVYDQEQRKREGEKLPPISLYNSNLNLSIQTVYSNLKQPIKYYRSDNQPIRVPPIIRPIKRPEVPSCIQVSRLQTKSN